MRSTQRMTWQPYTRERAGRLLSSKCPRPITANTMRVVLTRNRFISRAGPEGPHGFTEMDADTNKEDATQHVGQPGSADETMPLGGNSMSCPAGSSQD